MEEQQKLYRFEALQGRRSSMFGAVKIAQPVSLVAMSALVVLIMAILVAFLVYGEYARKVTVQGYLMPESGVSRVYSPTDGVASKVLVEEGQWVAEGDILVEISTVRGLEDGASLSAEILEELELQKGLLQTQIGRLSAEHEAELSWLQNRLDMAALEESQVRSALAIQQSRVKLSNKHGEALQKLEEGGYASNNQVMQVDADRLFEEKQLAELSLRLTRAEIERAQIERQLKREPTSHQHRLDDMGRELAAVSQQIKQIMASSQYVLYAPVSGHVSTKNIYEGARVLRNRSLLTVVPEESELFAWILLPSRAAGFAQEGNLVRLMYDSFPYQQFGTQAGEIVSISDTAISKLELADYLPLTSNEPVYVAKVKLEKDTITAFGEEKSLQLDMQLSADIVLAKRTILQWVLEPLYALRGRT